MFNWLTPRGDPLPGQTHSPPPADGPAFADEFYLGLDLGQAQDFSALVALRKRVFAKPPGGERPPALYTVRGLKRWPLKTLYTAIVEEVVALVEKPPLPGCVLGIDKTGCGAPVVDLFKKARPRAVIRPILITAGHEVTADGPGFHVAKVVLVSTVSTLLQARRLEIPQEIPEHKTLEKELLAFRAKVTTRGTEVFEADWRTRQHDDLVLGLAIAAFLGEGGGRRKIAILV